MERIPLVLYSSLSTFIGLAIFDGTTVFAATCFTYFESNVETSEMDLCFERTRENRSTSGGVIIMEEDIGVEFPHLAFFFFISLKNYKFF